MALDIKRFTARFVEEARDHLRRLEEGLSILHSDASDPEVINSIFRSAHTIKGSSRMLKLMPICDTAHLLEDILGALREGSLSYSATLGQLLQRGADAIAAQVEHVADGIDLTPPDATLCAELARALGNTVEETDDAKEAGGAAALPNSPDMSESTRSDSAAQTAEIKLRAAESVRVPLGKLDELVKLMGEMVSSHARLRQRVTDFRAIEHELEHDIRQELTVTGVGGHSRLSEFGRDLKDDVLAQEVLMEELHGKALILRMLPLAMVFDSAPRMVRDLARSIGKEVDCVISGSEIELDRQLIEVYKPPGSMVQYCTDRLCVFSIWSRERQFTPSESQ